MKLIKQKTLYFNEGNSDKVYEVDICEVSDELFVVNFRYGRRNSVLKEGTKTIFPVKIEEAEITFEKLVLSKTKKGYQENFQQEKLEPNLSELSENTIREETILKYLKEGTKGTYYRNWKLSKIIKRAGTLSIKEATNDITWYLNSKDEFEQYFAIETLAKFNAPTASNKIFKIFKEKGFDDKVGRIAVAYLIKSKEEHYISEILKAAEVNLSRPIAKNLVNSEEFLNSLSMYFIEGKAINGMTLYLLYLIAEQDSVLRNNLYNFISQIPLKVNFFKSIRYIFRASEVLNDLKFYSLIAKKIGVSSPGFLGTPYVDGEWINLDIEKTKSNPSIAFSSKTKNYFNNKTYKYIYNLSKENEEGFIELATSFLCSLNSETDKTKEEIKQEYRYNENLRRYELETQYFPKYNTFAALMYILYGNSNRFHRNKTKWFYIEKVDNKENLPREEVLQEVWNIKPQEVLYILANSKSEEAILFSLKILKENPSFLEQATKDIIYSIITHYDKRVTAIILSFLKEKYRATQPEEAIIYALLKSNSEEAISLATDWVNKYEKNYFSNPNFIINLLLTGKQEIIAYLRLKYKNEIAYNYDLVISRFQVFFNKPENYSEEYLLLVAKLIGETNFGKLFKVISKEEIEELLETDVITNKIFAANFCKHHKEVFYSIFHERLNELIDSKNEKLKYLGIELLAYFSDDFLLRNHQLITQYYFSKDGKIREAILPTISKLIELDSRFKTNLLKTLLNSILEKESYEGLHESIYNLLIKDYSKELDKLTSDQLLEMVLSKYDYGQKIGTPLFIQKVKLDNLSSKELILLGQSDVKEIRNLLITYLEKNIKRSNNELDDLLRIFNSDWKDIMNWSFEFFNKNINSENWTIERLIYICDHVKEEVQAFGRKLVTNNFSNEMGVELLLKLQEHPSKGMQFFTTNYLDTYAKGNVEVILKLESFFKTVLFNINFGRATKDRVFNFLENESIKDIHVAKMVVRIIKSILGTKTEIDKSKSVDLLLSINEAQPEIEIPLTINVINEV